MQKNRYILLLFTLMLSTSLWAQQKELVQVVVGNEGNFGSGNATITNYMVESGSSEDGVFLSANGTGIGDVVQSLAWINDRLYAVINNSQKIVILDPETFAQTGQITFPGGSSPREIIKVAEGKAYVTDLYAEAVYVVDLDNNSVAEATIPAGTNADRLIAYDGYAYVANSGFGADSTIFKVDIATDAVVDTLEVSRGPSGMAVDSEGNLWVVATGYSGDYDENWNLIPGTAKPGGLHTIDLSSGEEVAFAELTSADSDLALDEDDGMVYVNSGGVRAYDINAGTFAPDTLVKGSFYAMGYDEVNKDFYLADAKDYSSEGDVIIYNHTTAEADTFQAGIVPGSFLFVYDEMIETSNEVAEKVTGFELSQNYPNPFNPSTVISYQLTGNSVVRLEVFDVTGRKVATLVNGQQQAAGTHHATFDASGLSSGVYIYRLSTSYGSLSRKMLLMK